MLSMSSPAAPVNAWADDFGTPSCSSRFRISIKNCCCTMSSTFEGWPACTRNRIGSAVGPCSVAGHRLQCCRKRCAMSHELQFGAWRNTPSAKCKEFNRRAQLQRTGVNLSAAQCLATHQGDSVGYSKVPDHYLMRAAERQTSMKTRSNRYSISEYRLLLRFIKPFRF